MTDIFYQVAVGGDMHADVIKANTTSAGSPNEFRWTYDATGANKNQAIKALEAIRQYILMDKSPPV